MFSLTIKILGMVFLCSYMPLTAYSFWRFRLPKKEEEFKKIIKALEMDESIAFFFTPSFKDEYSPLDYAIPVAFTTFLVLLGSIVILLGHELKIAETPNLLFSGMKFNDPNCLEYQKQSLMVLGMGFLGAYVWSVENIFRRLVTVDLLPRAYYNISIRMILAALVALTLHHLFSALPGEKYFESIMPVIAFLTGMFPERAIHYLKNRISIFSGKDNKIAKDLPLDMLEGMSLLHKIRLSEIGIDNAQNLANANLIEVYLKTPFQAKQLVDWAGQAKLFMYFKSEIDKLREIGIRTIYDLKIIKETEGRLKEVAQSTGIPELQLEIVCRRIEEDPSMGRLQKVISVIG
jgi:hypothetical protein